MTIHLEVFRSKSIKSSPAGLWQSKLICWDAELQGNSPLPPRAHAHLAGVAGRGWRDDARPSVHSRRSLPSLLPNTSWRKLIRRRLKEVRGAEATGLRRKSGSRKQAPPQPAGVGSPPRRLARSRGSRRGRRGLTADPLAAATSSSSADGQHNGKPGPQPRGPRTSSSRSPNTSTAQVAISERFQQTGRAHPPREWELE